MLTGILIIIIIYLLKKNQKKELNTDPTIIDIKNKTNNPITYDTNVVGMQYYEKGMNEFTKYLSKKYGEYIHHPKFGRLGIKEHSKTFYKYKQGEIPNSTITLVKEPSNNFDENAIAVYFKNKYQIGYLPSIDVNKQIFIDATKLTVIDVDFFGGPYREVNHGIFKNIKRHKLEEQEDDYKIFLNILLEYPSSSNKKEDIIQLRLSPGLKKDFYKATNQLCIDSTEVFTDAINDVLTENMNR